jgi:hypothetical protein
MLPLELAPPQLGMPPQLGGEQLSKRVLAATFPFAAGLFEKL